MALRISRILGLCLPVLPAALVLGAVALGATRAPAWTESPELAIQPAPALRDDVEIDFEADVEFALEQMESLAGDLIKQKGIDWKKVTKQFKKEAKKTEGLSEQWALLARLAAKLEDGHAYVAPKGPAAEIKWPDDGRAEYTGPGIFLCKIGKKYYVKNSFATAASVEVGSEILKINGTKPAKWVEERLEANRLYGCYSTQQQAFFNLCHWGMADAPGAKLKLDVKLPSSKKHTYKLTYRDASTTAWGPAFFPNDRVEGGRLSSSKNVNWGLLDSGFGYVHIRRCKGTLPEEVQEALDAIAASGPCKGIIVDFRGNSGGGFDHEDFFGRFLPAGEKFGVGKSYVSTGDNPFGGPMVVIVDATVRSAGETAAGILKEDGRGYMIGESATAGMSSSKEMIQLPSGCFEIRVSVYSNKMRFNEGRGIEGIGVIPHEIVEFDPKDLAAERDTLILRAEQLLGQFPKDGFPTRVAFEPK